ncbi:MAG: hypothetical protein ACMUIL_00850 [bacterium]
MAQGTSFLPSGTSSWDVSMYYPYTSYSSSGRYWPAYSSYGFGQTNVPWMSFQGVTRYAFPSGYPSIQGGYQYLFGGFSMHSSLPQGCTLRWDERRCTSRGACHTPLYCPVYIPGYF